MGSFSKEGSSRHQDLLSPGCRAQGALCISHSNILGSHLVQKLEAAIAVLDSGVDGPLRQEELSELLHWSKTSPELLRKLEKITNPTPSLALEMCRAFRREGQPSTGMRLLQQSSLPVACDDKSSRLCVQTQGELALCESNCDDDKACDLFEGAVLSSIKLLGRTDMETIRLRVTFAEFLESSSRYTGALDVLSTLTVDCEGLLHPWTEVVKQMEERLRIKRVKKRRRERPMPTKQTLTEDNKENVPQSGPHSQSKKRKLMRESGT